MPHGDPELAAKLAAIAGRTTRSVAAAVIGLRDEIRVRCAFIDAGPRTRFELGSVTKALTGMLLADAITRGEVSLGTDVGTISPNARGTELGSVTMQELCTHTSGLARVGGGHRVRARALQGALFGTDPYRGTTGSDLLKGAARQPLSQRGRYRYSNLGAALLGELLATTAGSDYPSLLRDRIFIPIGLRASSVSARNDTAPRGWSSAGRRPRPWIMDGYAPAGAVVSTIADMADLACSLLQGSAPGKGSLVAIAGVETDRPCRETGMFWVIDRRPESDRSMIWHNGQTGGYSAFFAIFPQSERAVVVLANVARAAEPQRIALALVRRPSVSP
ncbi:MAG: serine hydrolase domain-containing protein [Acidimicrobiia bacterium]